MDKTQTPEFKRWFGKSKVVDQNGKPLVLFHGTVEDFHSFDRMAWGSVTPKLAGEYAAMRADRAESEKKEKYAQLMPIYMRIENPFNASDPEVPTVMTLGGFAYELIEQAKGQGREPSKSVAERVKELVNIAWRGAKMEESGPHYSRHSFWFETVSLFGKDGAAALREMFDILGYDGVKMIENDELTYGAFSSAQVKSAFNNGSFSPDNPNITEDADDDLETWFGNSKIFDSDGKPMIVYHGTGKKFDAFADNDGGIHFGTVDQATMRNRTHQIEAYIKIEKPVRKKDTSGGWKNTIKAAKSRGYDGIIYLNRYEGIPRERFEALRAKGITDERMDAMSDTMFRRMVPEASDSYIVFSPKQVRMVSDGASSITESEVKPSRFSRQFKLWFDQSKVVDAQGAPLPVYHGSRADVGAFKYMSHFGTSKAANERLSPSNQWSNGEGGVQANVYAVYLSIQNPLNLGREYSHETKGAWQDDADMAWQIVTKLESLGKAKQARRMQQIATQMAGATINPNSKFLEDMANTILEAGFDGLVYKNDIEDAGSISWVALFPSQVKSVFNKGNWDATNDHISESLDMVNTHAIQWRASPEAAVRFAKRQSARTSEKSTVAAVADFDAGDSAKGQIIVDIQYFPGNSDDDEPTIIVQDFRFSINDLYHITGERGSNESLRIYSTAVNCLIDVAKSINPDMIVFRSNETQKDRLYAMIAKRIPNYTLTNILPSKVGKRFVITRNDRLE